MSTAEQPLSLSLDGKEGLQAEKKKEAGASTADNNQRLLLVLEESSVKEPFNDGDFDLFAADADKASEAITFSSDLSQLQAVRELIETLCEQRAQACDLFCQHLQLAINEAFCNIAKHGYGEGCGGTVTFRVATTHEGIAVELSDQGISFDPSIGGEPDCAGGSDNGFGCHLIRAVADTITYIAKSQDSKWNRLYLFKRYDMGEQMMKVECKERGDTLVITLDGKTLDAKEAPTFKQEVIDIITNRDATKVIFDLSLLQFIDSSGLGSFLAILRFLNKQGGDLRLAVMNKTVRTMFQLVSMHKIFEIYNRVDDAVHSFKTHSAPASTPSDSARSH